MKNLQIVANIKVYRFSSLPEGKKNLIIHAQNAAKKAYSPYSGYNVGAAVMLENTKMITGNNQENAAYPSGLCAERTALFYANAEYPDQPVAMLAIAAYFNGDYTSDVCTPCGSCRQVLAEVESRYNKPITILMCSKDLVYEVDSVDALLPLSFNKKALDK